MPKNRKTLYLISCATLVVLLLTFFLPLKESGRYVGATVLVPSALVCFFLLKKRVVPSINRRMVLLLLSIFGVLFVALYYLSGIKVGFANNIYRLNAEVIFNLILPISVIIVFSEIIRYVILSQESHFANVLCYIICIISEALTYGNFHYVDSFNRFMDFVGVILLPAVISNLLYNYLSKRYGMLPNLVFRLITTLYVYVIPVVPIVSDSLLSFAKLFYPLIIYVFIHSLYGRKIRYALKKNSKLAVPITVLAFAAMACVIMLISNHFRFGALVIATESMTGELNKGDIVVFDQDDDHIVTEGEIIVFEKDGMSVVHRVVKIEHINGTTRYYTKGDANETEDFGYITKSNIKGVVKAKLPYFGYPTLWLRSAISKATNN